MKVTFRTWEELQEKGFKYDWRRCYVGNKASPSASFNSSWVQTHLGKTFEVLSIDPDDAQIEIMSYSKTLHVPYWILVEEDILLRKVKQAPRLRLTRSGKPARLLPDGDFRFPCEFSKLSKKSAVKLARWILKVSKGKA